MHQMKNLKRARIVTLATLFVMLATGAPAQSDSVGARQQEFELTSDVFDNTRAIRVLLPPSYFEPAHAQRRYPVFYFTDGWDAWHGWGLPEVAKQLWDEGAIPEVIFIGINNGGRTRESKDVAVDRANEYLPYRDPFWPDQRPDPNGDLFPDFLFDDVMPAVNERFRTKTGADNTGLAGSSYGGIAVLYAVLVRPDRIGYLLAESPSLHVGRTEILELAAHQDRLPLRVYLGVGTDEGDTAEDRADTVASVEALHGALGRRLNDDRLRMVVTEGGTHWYDAWQERLPVALTFLLADTK
jgi:enterochelin esterase-like enzyme